MNKGQEELFNKLMESVHDVHQDIVGKIANGEALTKIQASTEEWRMEIESRLDEIKAVLIGNEFHTGHREVLQQLEKEAEELKKDLNKIKSYKGSKKHTAKELGIGGGVIIAIVEVIEYIKRI